MQFKELNINSTIVAALEREGYTEPTPIQVQAIPPVLAGRDLLGCAQTGTGKTAAFAVPTIQLLSEDKTVQNGKRRIRSLILTPTRELAVQIYESFLTYGHNSNLRCCVIYGGVSQKPSELLLRSGIDILVATPGRLNDLMNQGLVDLQYIKIFILDEADRMLDMGFINDVKKVIEKIPKIKQTLLFSATIPPEITKMASSLLINPVKISITPESPTVDMIDQYLYFVDKGNKRDLLMHILKDKAILSALVFTRTKHGADKVVKDLASANINAAAIHGNKSQNARQAALNDFKAKRTRVLVATDIAARGIDIDELSHVINYELPNVPETYVHRIGRTGRAGLGGTAISFCDFEEKPLLKDIEKLIGKGIPLVEDHPYPLMITTVLPKAPPQQRRPRVQAIMPDTGRSDRQRRTEKFTKSANKNAESNRRNSNSNW
jgi:ATP-dependent RNA helicase RhlE